MTFTPAMLAARMAAPPKKVLLLALLFWVRLFKV